ncbi:MULTISPECIES: hypothetical protein [unclassified Lactococcus]|uniref:hypothetical protein n=1 Tax=unclassified Lactococcus TaxID=2643510 RepID=UPI0011C7EB5F|nr:MULTISPECIES: hypothetical protein [unclassified Lactococcus]MQW21979.1 hypothetical protein [Lactococcus sp. dk101]TXK36840.1 hypothetical protein FVP42_10715 [Lactococcus sp. dk310]TXK47462.1 hypothetical protein FVP43_10125 [Lactococcus sp. dk322]
MASSGIDWIMSEDAGNEFIKFCEGFAKPTLDQYFRYAKWSMKEYGGVNPGHFLSTLLGIQTSDITELQDGSETVEGLKQRALNEV